MLCLFHSKLDVRGPHDGETSSSDDKSVMGVSISVFAAFSHTLLYVIFWGVVFQKFSQEFAVSSW